MLAAAAPILSASHASHTFSAEPSGLVSNPETIELLRAEIQRVVTAKSSQFNMGVSVGFYDGNTEIAASAG